MNKYIKVLELGNGQYVDRENHVFTEGEIPPQLIDCTDTKPEDISVNEVGQAILEISDDSFRCISNYDKFDKRMTSDMCSVMRYFGFNSNGIFNIKAVIDNGCDSIEWVTQDRRIYKIKKSCGVYRLYSIEGTTATEICEVHIYMDTCNILELRFENAYVKYYTKFTYSEDDLLISIGTGKQVTVGGKVK